MNFHVLAARRRLGGCLMIACAGVLVYANHLHNPFQFDTVAYLDNHKWTDPAHMLNWRFFIDEYFSRSLLQISFALNAVLGKEAPFGYHLINLTLHIVNSLLIFFITEKMLRYFLKAETGESSTAQGLSLLTSLLFLCHPIQTESVVYVMSRSEVLAATFYLLGFYTFQSVFPSRDTPLSSKKLTTALPVLTACFVLGFGVKQTCITLPAVLLLYYLFGQPPGSSVRTFLHRMKWKIGALALLPLAWLFHKLFTDESFLVGPVNPEEMVGRKNYLLSQPVVIAFYYLRLLVFPVNLNIDPDLPVITHGLSLPFIAATFLLALLVYLAVRRASSALPLFCLSWFFIVLSPSSSIVTLHDLAAEHRVYLAAFGVFLFAALLLQKTGNSLSGAGKSTWKWNAGAGMACVPVLFFLLCANRNLDWSRQVSLWADAQKKSPRTVRPLINLARAHHLAGDTEKAATLYESALRRAPHIFATNYNLGGIYFHQGRREEALRLLQTARDLSPNVAEVHGKLGEVYQSMDRYREADRHYQKAVELNPRYATVMRNLGIINYFHLHQPELGILYFSRALTLDPDQPEAEHIRALIEQAAQRKGPA